MSWESNESYQQLVEMQPDLKDNSHRDAFHEFLARMWTKPDTYIDFAKAYMEFTTASHLTFPKLKALEPVVTGTGSSRKSRRSRRRNSRKRKQARTPS